MTSYDYEITFISYIFTTQIPNFFQSPHTNSYHSKLFDDVFYNMPKGAIGISKMQSIYHERERNVHLEHVKDDLGKWDNL